MTTKVEIVNAGLIKLNARPINSLSEVSNEATLANQVWDISRKAVLREHYWNFAIKEIELARINDRPLMQYEYIFQLPTDFIRLVKLDNDTDFKIINNRVYTNKKDCILRYVYDNKNTSTWDAMFVDLMAIRIAKELAYTITTSSAHQDRLQNEYLFILKKAKYYDATDESTDTLGPISSSIIDVRF